MVAVPTLFPELNAVLAELVASGRRALGDNFCGAYLVGSFALGDADEHSDVDFLVVTHDDVTADELGELQATHERLYRLPSPWAQHLDGSYVPKGRLRHVDPSGHPFLYLDNGASRLVWDSHCNTAVLRWSLRERGIALAGPDPRALVADVPADELRGEARTRARDYAKWAAERDGAGWMSKWKQVYLVLTFCRLLQTVSEARVSSKREAAQWALRALDRRWAPLIKQALGDRAEPGGCVDEPAEPEAIDSTLRFARYTVRWINANSRPF